MVISGNKSFFYVLIQLDKAGVDPAKCDAFSS